MAYINSKYAWLAIVVIGGLLSAGFAAGIATHGYSYTGINATMSAYGSFDRVVLNDRHFGSWNGQEVEGEQLAILTSEGNTTIENPSYYPFQIGRNALFWLYVFAGPVNETTYRLRISVEGGNASTLQFETVNVTISLETELFVVEPGPFTLFFLSYFLVMEMLFIPIWYWATKPID
jgi:hypothetical protein